MYRDHLPLTALPAWCKLNDVNFLDSKVEDLGESKGFGLITERSLNSKETFDIPTLLTIPRDLILSGEAVEEHAKADGAFRQLIEAAGGKVCLGDSSEMDVRNVANWWLEFERRCDVVSFDASYDWVTRPWHECGLVYGLDGLCEDDAWCCSCSDDVV